MTLKISMKQAIASGVATEAMNTLAGGPFLIAYAMMFGAGPIAIGFLGSLDFLGWITHLIAAYMIERGQTPRQISVWSGGIARLFYLIIGVLAFYHTQKWALPVLVVSLTLMNLIGGLTGGAFYPWMKALIPERLMARFFARRYQYMMIVSVICYAIGGGILFLWRKQGEEIYGYATLLFMAFICGVVSVFSLAKVQNVTIEAIPEKFTTKTVQVLHQKSFYWLCLLMAMVNLTERFILPFITVFILKQLHFSMSVVIGLTLVSQLVYIATTKKWSRFIEKQGCCQTLIRGIMGYGAGVACFLGCSCEKPIIVLVLLVLAHFAIGSSRFAVDLGRNNMPLMVLPKRNAAVSLSMISVSKALSATLAGILAGGILMILEKMYGHEAWNLFWGICMIECLMAICLLYYVQMKGKRP